VSARERRAKERRLQRRTLTRAAAPAAVSGVLFATALACAPAPAAASTLSVSQVANLNTTPTGSSPTDITLVGNTAYFVAGKPGVGTELWKSDGTAAGTTFVDDIFPGNGSSYPTELTNVGGTLFFVANDGSGSQVWRTDGTIAGTTAVTSPDTGQFYYPRSLINAAGALYFIDHGHVWKSDGTPAGTVELSAATPNSDYLAAVGGTVYFTEFTNGTSQLWKTDGTPTGTTEVTALPLAGVTASMEDVGGILYFGISGQSTGLELWKSDGTSAGTAEVTQIGPASPGYPAMGDWANLNGTLVFVANDGSGPETWKSDGTAGGTQILADVAPAAYSYSERELAAANGKLYFFATSPGGATPKLWETDGTAGGTVAVSDLGAGAHGSYFQDLTAVGSTLFFDSDTAGLMSDDGVVGDPVTVIGPADARYLTNLQGTLIFSGNDGSHGAELWRSDGTSGGTSMVDAINSLGNAASYPGDFINVNGGVYFIANDGSHDGIWKSDGTATGTTLVDTVTGGNYGSELVNFAGELYFTSGGALYAASGGNGNATAVSNPSNAEDINDLTVAGNTLYFYARNASNGWGLWKSTGSAITLVDSSGQGNLTTGYGNAYPLVAAGGNLYFLGNDGTHGWELWKSDGTTAGTQMVDDIDPGTASGWPRYLTNVNGTVYFTADDGTHGFELWRSDGTAAGTQLVDDIDAGTQSSVPHALANAGGTLYFSAQDPTGGGAWELWKTDGTQTGTQAVDPGGVYNPSSVADINGEIFFTASDTYGEVALWKTDGTTAGSQIVKDIHPWTGAVYFPGFANFNGTLVFVNNDGTHGSELWQSDGTASGTFQVADIDPGPASGVAIFGELLPVGDNLFFGGNDGTNGWELWKAYVPTSPNGGGGSGGTPGSGPGGSTPGSGNGPPANTGNGVPPSLKFTSTKVSGDDATIKLTLPGTTTGSYTITVTLSVVETVEGNKVLGVAASDRTPLKKKQKPVKKTVVVGTKTVNVKGGQTVSLSVALNGAGRKLLAMRHHLSVKLAASDKGKTLASKTLSFTAPKKKTK
jgi:ELWxxDGT repeat protein